MISGASFKKKICPSPSNVREVRQISVQKLSEVRVCPKIAQTLTIGNKTVGITRPIFWEFHCFRYFLDMKCFFRDNQHKIYWLLCRAAFPVLCFGDAFPFPTLFCLSRAIYAFVSFVYISLLRLRSQSFVGVGA